MFKALIDYCTSLNHGNAIFCIQECYFSVGSLYLEFFKMKFLVPPPLQEFYIIKIIAYLLLLYNFYFCLVSSTFIFVH